MVYLIVIYFFFFRKTSLGLDCLSVKKVWPRNYAHSSFSSLVQSLLPKDTLLRKYLTSLQLVTGTVWWR